METDIIEAEDTQTHIAEIICTTKIFVEKIKSKNTNQREGASMASSNSQPTTEIIHQTAHGEAEQVGNQPSTSQEEQNQIESNTVGENVPVELNQSISTSTSETNTNHNISNSSYSMSRLPKLALPTFDGNPLSWQSFWDSFCTAVHDNPHLGNIQKLNYLRAQFSGEAPKSIAGFTLTESNYLESIKLLKERFGQPH